MQWSVLALPNQTQRGPHCFWQARRAPSEEMHMQKNRLLYVLLSFLILTSTNAQEKRLDYRQEQSLKDAKYYLDQSEGIVQQLDEKSKGWKVGDSTVQIQDVQNVIRNLDRV